MLLHSSKTISHINGGVYALPPCLPPYTLGTKPEHAKKMVAVNLQAFMAYINFITIYFYYSISKVETHRDEPLGTESSLAKWK